MKLSGLLIASGLSSRISGFKPLLRYEEKSFLIAIIEKMLSVLSNVIIVVGHNHIQLLEELNTHFNDTIEKANDVFWMVDNRIKIIYNKDYREGMFTSLQLGAKQLIDSDWILYHFIDQPNLPKEFYGEILKQQIKSSNWVQPLFNGVKGHPIIFGKKVLSKIIDADYSSNLREVLKDKSLIKDSWHCNFPEILEDIDTDEDYRKLLQARLDNDSESSTKAK